MKMKCKCGNENFFLEWGNLICSKCKARKFITYSSEEHKVMKPNGKHFFWVVLTPKFMERMERYFPDVMEEELLQACSDIEKFYKGEWPKVRVTTNGARWKDYNIYWKYKFNPQKKRVELIMFSITELDRLTSKRNEKVEFVKVSFNE